MRLDYAEIDPSEPSGIPARKVNGGLYTGEAATGNWGCYSVIPESYIYITQNLKSANPPPRGMDTIPGGDNRVGNSTQLFPNHKKYSSMLNLNCVDKS
jgi:hypothetical protein